jgi:hypothetical protein
MDSEVKALQRDASFKCSGTFRVATLEDLLSPKRIAHQVRFVLVFKWPSLA